MYGTQTVHIIILTPRLIACNVIINNVFIIYIYKYVFTLAVYTGLLYELERLEYRLYFIVRARTRVYI